MENKKSQLNLSMTNPIQHFKYPTQAYNNLLGGIRKINNELALELNANLKAGRNQRVIQRIDKELNKRERNTVLYYNILIPSKMILLISIQR